MNWYNWIGIAAICFVCGCASTRGTTVAGRENASISRQSEKSEQSAKSDAPRLRIRRIAPQSPGEQSIATRRIALSKDLTSEKSAVDEESVCESVEIRLVHDADAETDAASTGKAVTSGKSFVTLAATDDAISDTVPPTPTRSDEEPSSPAESAEKSLAESEASLPAGYPLSLDNVLFLADAKNPNVIFARERINEAYARVDRAQALWLPSIRAGGNYYHHEGNVQDVTGNVFSTNKSNFYSGFGAGSGAGSGPPAIPGLVAQFHLADAIFQPKITGHQAASRKFGATAARNDILRNTAIAYLELLRAEQALAIAEEALSNTGKLADLTGNYANTGQGLRSDYERMLAEKGIREADVATRVEGVRVASARLAQLLHADASVRISTNEPVVVPFDLLERDLTPASLVATALMRRPELAEQKHLVCEAVERLKREKYAPLVPSVLLGMSYGGFGGGLGSTLGNTSSRMDADAMAYWEIRNLGIGERAARNETSSLVRQTQQRELAIMDQVAREVVESQAQVFERQKRIEIGKQTIIAAERSYKLNVERIRNAQGLPIETLQSIQALAGARLTYLNAVVDFNIAQFELCRAIGWFQGT